MDLEVSLQKYMPFQIVSDPWQDGNFLATNSMDNTVSQSTFQQLPLIHLHSACNHETFESFRTMKCHGSNERVGSCCAWQVRIWDVRPFAGQRTAARGSWVIFPAKLGAKSGAHFTQTNLDIVTLLFDCGKSMDFGVLLLFLNIFVYIGPFSFSLNLY